MTVSTWRRIEPALPLAEHVHLQGWGEPLLQPSLREMVRSAKRAGAKVGITTNGDLLESAVDWVVDEQLDLVTVSIGADAEPRTGRTDPSARARALDAAGALASRTRKSRRRPKVQVGYLLTRDNAPELASVVEAAASAGVHEFYVTHLDVTPNENLWNRRAFDLDGLKSGVAANLDAAEQTARRHRMPFRGPARRAEEDLVVCALNPDQFVFVGWDGRVGPCVNVLLPIQGPIPRWGGEGFSEVAPVWYGHLDDLPLTDILAGRGRSHFTDPFRKRLRAEQRLRDALASDPGSEALKRLNALCDERDAALRAAPFPDACAGCHKRVGW
jgi:hypothetical protein